MLKIKEKDLFFNEKIISIFIVIDLLILPYFRLLHCGFGMLIIAVWFLFNINRISLKTFVASISIFISFFIGVLYFKVDLKKILNAGLIVYVFVLYDYFMYVDIGNKNIIKKIIYLYLFFIFLISIIYIIMPRNYFIVRQFWTMNNASINFTELIINRFTFIFSDPNNAGNIIVSLLLYLLVYEKINIIWLIFSIVPIFITFSVSSNMMLVFSLILFCVIKIKTKEQRNNKKKLLIFLLMISIFSILGISIIMKNDLIQVFINRLSMNSSNGLGGRQSIWIKVLKNIDPLACLLLGRGAVVDTAGRIYAPHNGFLYLLYSYGGLTLIIFIIKFFKVSYKNLIFYLPILPILSNIFMNTGFEDYRFITLAILIIAIVHTKLKDIKKYKGGE